MPDDAVEERDTVGTLDPGDAPDFYIEDGDLEAIGAPTQTPFSYSSEGLDDEPDDDYDGDDYAAEATELPAPAPSQKGLALNQSTRAEKLAALKEATPEAVLDHISGLRSATTRAQQEAAELRRREAEYEQRLDALEKGQQAPQAQAAQAKEPNPADVMAWSAWFSTQTGTNPTGADYEQAKQRFELNTKYETQQQRLERLEQASFQQRVTTASNALIDERPELKNPDWRAKAFAACAQYMDKHNLPPEELRSAYYAVFGPQLLAHDNARRSQATDAQAQRARDAATPSATGPAGSAKPDFTKADPAQIARWQKAHKSQRRR